MNELILKVPSLTRPAPVPYVPLPTQAAFHRSPAKYRAIIAGMGNGKTNAAAVETISTALLYPGSVNAVVRWDQTRLRDTSWLSILNILNASGLESLIKRHVNTPQACVLEFTNGSVLKGFHAKNWKSFGSLELSSFYLDEAAECPDSDAYDQLCARVGRHPIGPARGWLVGLPDAHNWVWQRFVKQNLPGHDLFRGTVYDNPFLRPEYAAEMKRIYGPEKALVLLMGSFDSIEGKIFEMFDPTLHVIPRRTLDRSWPRYAAIDPGFSPDPCGMLRAACDPEGNILLEAEYLKTGRVTEQWSQDILAVNAAAPPMFYVIDPSADRNTHASVISVIDTARRSGINPLRSGNNDTEQSIARIRSLLTPDPNRIFPSYHPKAGQKGSPRLFIFEDLARMIWELSNYRMKKSGAASALKGIRPQEHDNDLVDCFVAGTLITTASGEVPIEQIQPGDLVWTRDGLRPVVAAWLTGERGVMTAAFSHGRSLTGTPMHPVWSVDEEQFVPLTSLRPGAIIAEWTGSHPSSFTTEGSASTATPTPASAPTASTTRATWMASFVTSIASFTRIIMDRSRPAMRSITRTRIPSTTSLATWWPSLRVTTGSTATAARSSTAPTGSNGSTWPRSDRSPLPGTPPTPASPGTLTTAAGCGKTARWSPGSARSAAGSTPAPASAITPGSVPITASQPTGAPLAWTTNSGSAPSAGSPSPATATSRRATAGTRVVRVQPAEPAPVYNLQVAGTPEYYANGVLVHNCLRYLSLEHLTAAAATAPPPMSDFWAQVLAVETKDAAPYVVQIGGRPRTW